MYYCHTIKCCDDIVNKIAVQNLTCIKCVCTYLSYKLNSYATKIAILLLIAFVQLVAMLQPIAMLQLIAVLLLTAMLLLISTLLTADSYVATISSITNL